MMDCNRFFRACKSESNRRFANEITGWLVRMTRHLVPDRWWPRICTSIASIRRRRYEENNSCITHNMLILFRPQLEKVFKTLHTYYTPTISISFYYYYFCKKKSFKQKISFKILNLRKTSKTKTCLFIYNSILIVMAVQYHFCNVFWLAWFNICQTHEIIHSRDVFWYFKTFFIYFT